MTKPPASLDEIVAAHAIDIELAVKRARLAYEIATTSLFRDVSHFARRPCPTGAVTNFERLIVDLVPVRPDDFEPPEGARRPTAAGGHLTPTQQVT